MVFLNLLAGALAFGGPASARIFHSSVAHEHAHRRHEDLISIPRDATVDSASTIKADTPNEILQPIRPSHAKRSRKPIDLLEEDSLFWAGASGTIAELRIKMPGKKEAVVDMEYFEDLIDQVVCHQTDAGVVSIRFSDRLDFDDAADVWSWVSQDEGHEFLLMVGAGDCGWNDDRILFRVQDLDFTDATNTANLQTTSVTWKQAIHSYDLIVGKAANLDSGAASRLREVTASGIDIIPDFEVPVEADISGKGIAFAMNGVELSGFCTECSVAGTFNVDAKFSVGFFELEEAAVEVTTEGVDIAAIMDVTVKGELTDSLLTKTFPLFKASPAGIAIPGIVTIGPVITVAVTAGISSIKGGVKLTLGGKATIPASTARLDFLSEDSLSFEGWEPEFEPVPLKADAFVEVKASTALRPSIGLEISVLETGFAAEIAAETPSLSASLKAIHSTTCTACDQFQNAIEGSITLGASITAALQKKIGGTFEDLWSLTLFDASIPPLASFCEAIGPQPEECPVNGNGTLLTGRRERIRR